MARADRDKTTFTTFLRTYRHKRMSLALKNAPATFQRALDIILAGSRWQTCLIYLDDMIVFSRSVTDHLGHVGNVLQQLRKAGVTLRKSKCALLQPRFDYLGHVISPRKNVVASQNAEAFRVAVFPKDTTLLRSFLGVANVYRRFMKNYSRIARPLNRMLSKDANPEWGDPSEEQKQAFETLKEKLVSPPILSLPMKVRPFMIDTDASAYRTTHARGHPSGFGPSP